jgi:uncharacterized repeat protein (TIGR01451 family)
MMAALICTVDSQKILAPGETWTFTRNYTVQESDICQDIVNIAHASATDTCIRVVGPVEDNETVPTKYNPYIFLNMVSDKSGEEVDTGEIITYTYYVENRGDVNLTNVSLIDDIISPVLYISGDKISYGVLNPGEVWIYEGIYEVKVDDLCHDIVNTAVLTATDPCKILRNWKDHEAVKTSCTPKICCQDRENKNSITLGDQHALGLHNGNAENNVKVVSYETG